MKCIVPLPGAGVIRLGGDQVSLAYFGVPQQILAGELETTTKCRILSMRSDDHNLTARLGFNLGSERFEFFHCKGIAFASWATQHYNVYLLFAGHGLDLVAHAPGTEKTLNRHSLSFGSFPRHRQQELSHVLHLLAHVNNNRCGGLVQKACVNHV